MILAGLVVWIQKRLGLLLGAFVAYLGKRWFDSLCGAVANWLRRRRRARQQRETAAAFEKDVQEGTERSEEQRAREANFLNS